MQLLRTLLILTLLASPCWGADSSRKVGYPPNKVMGFLGLDTRSTSPLLADGRATAIQNITLSKDLSLTKRYGYSVINDTLDDLDLSSPPITGIFDAGFSDGTNFPIAFVGSKLKYDNATTWATVNKTTPITSGKDNQWQCVMAYDSAVCTNDVDVVAKIDVTPNIRALDVSDLTDTLTKAKAVVFHKNFLIFGNTVEAGTERPQRFRWTNVGTIETLSDNDFVDIGALAGDEITGFAELKGSLYTFLKDNITRASLVGGNDVFAFTKVVDGIGAISRGSIQNVRIGEQQLGVIFLDERKHIYLFNGIGVIDIGSRIQPTLDNFSEARLQYSVATFDDHNYCLSATQTGGSTNDTMVCYQTEIGEWLVHEDINANAFARVKNSNVTKTYFGNYESFVYWMDDPDQNNDVDGATGVIDSVGTVDTTTITGAQTIIDAGLASGTYTGATIKITSGTGVGEEAIVMSNLNQDTGLVVVSAFSTTPDTTSNYSIGAIDANYSTKWYDFGDSSRKKNFRQTFFWGKEDSSNAVTVSFAEDFGSTLNSETKSLAPASSSTWDSAVWDEATWGTTGDRFETIKLKGRGRYLQLKFENSSINETFKIYGFHMLADALDVQ